MFDSWWVKLPATLAIGFGIIKLLKFVIRKKLRPPYYSITEYENDVIYVFEFPRKWTRQMINLSPFAVKLESWLRMKKVNYKVGLFN